MQDYSIIIEEEVKERKNMIHKWDMQYKVYIWFGVYEIRNIDARLFFDFYTKG